ncbi:MAG: iron-sulfur cluster assembly accessory protein [Gammaproteobacteria bacterium]|nr:iron-sulfur cluster assembly accessory protein [Gammaproteobacteria bacterium]
MSITLTTSAIERVQHYLKKRGSGIGLRLGVKRTGCSGYAYLINYAEEITDDDVVFEEQGLKVIVDPESLKIIDGTEVDFVKEGLAEMFRFRNPRAIGECGCGESFTIDEDRD